MQWLLAVLGAPGEAVIVVASSSLIDLQCRRCPELFEASNWIFGDSPR